jgi:single-strand DNA-binding protein
MSRDYHATEFSGRLAADPETKYAESNGTATTRFRVLVNEEWKDRSDTVQKHVESYAVIAFNGLAESCGSFLARGRRVFVRGRNRTRSYDGRDGKKRWVTGVIAETVQFLDGRRADDKPQDTPDTSHPTPGYPQSSDPDDADF